jgi:hypothetical protein
MSKEEGTRRANQPSQQEQDELRARYIDRCVTPFVREMMQKHPRLLSATILVAQYWNDEADDAVHYEVAFSPREAFDLETIEFGEEHYGQEAHSDSYAREFCGLSLDVGENSWNENYDAIPLFAAFCKEGSTQDDEFKDAYTPYAVFRREISETEAGLREAALRDPQAREVLRDYWEAHGGVSQTLTLKVVGEMLRPHLDGVRPEWDGEES